MAKSPEKLEKPEKQGNPESAAEQTEQAPSSGKRKGLLIGLALIVISGAALAWYLLDKPQSQAQAQPQAAQPRESAPVFLALEPFTVNLQPETGDQYLQTDITLKVADQKAIEAIKGRMPEVRNRLLLLLSSKAASQLISADGKRALAEAVRLEIMYLMDPALRPIKKSPSPPAGEEADAAAATDAADSGAPDQPAEEDAGAAEPDADQAPPLVREVLFTSFLIQ